MNKHISIDQLMTLLEYEADTGILRWKRETYGRSAHGSVAGCLNHKGYRIIGINGAQYRAHRIIVAMHLGRWPPESLVIDHKDGNRDNNRIGNLRLCTPSENQHNRVIPSNNSSGLLGVSYDRESRNWRASICINRKRIRVGNYPTAQLAHQAYLAAKAILHPCQPVPRKASK